MKRREWVVPLGPFGGTFEETARLQRTREHWAVVAPVGLWGDAGPRNEPTTLESAEADYRAYKALLLHIKTNLKERCPIRKDRHVHRNIVTGELVLRWDACQALGLYVPTPEARQWCQNAAALLEAAGKDDTFILTSNMKKTTATELRAAATAKARRPEEDDGRIKGRRLEEPRQPKDGEWSVQEDMTLVRWLGPRSNGTRAPLAPRLIATMLESLPGRSMRAIRNRVTRLNKLLLLGLGSGEVARVPSCFGTARLALAKGLLSTATLYQRYALGANVRVRGAMKQKSKAGAARPSPLRQELEELRKDVTTLQTQMEALLQTTAK